MSAKSSVFGYLQWYSGFIVPGITPKKFLQAFVIASMPCVFSLQKSMIASASSSQRV